MAASSISAHSHRVRGLNDALRQSFSGGRVVMTAGVAALPEATRATLLAAVRAFDCFDTNNDPYREHDFGAVTVGDIRALWKSDAYDRALAYASPDPTDPPVYVRVLAVMLAQEY